MGRGKIEKGTSRCSGEVHRVASNGSEYGTVSTLGNDEPCVSKQLVYMDPMQRHNAAQGGRYMNYLDLTIIHYVNVPKCHTVPYKCVQPMYQLKL